MKTTTLKKRSIIIDGHKTSVSLEDVFWPGLQDIAPADGVPVSSMIARIDKARDHFKRLFVLSHCRPRRPTPVADVQEAA
jgi:predicted DNA-binding ribbon-helix-helix protein